MIFRDPPEHTRIRSLVNMAFTPSRVEALRTFIEAKVKQLIDGFAHKGEVDILEEFAFPLPLSVICHMLGVPVDEAFQFKKWSKEIGRTVDPVQTAETQKENDAVMDVILAYFRKLIARKKQDSSNDLLSAMIRAEENGTNLNEAELFANAILIFLTGYETTVNLIGNGLWDLLSRPDQTQKLRGDMKWLSGAVEEMLRFSTPVVFNACSAQENLVIGGKMIHKGEQIFNILAAANRDPRVFDDPEKFDITRNPNPHFSFTQGNHVCLGANLARLEVQIAIRELLIRFPNLKLNQPNVEWRNTITIRGIKELRVSLH